MLSPHGDPFNLVSIDMSSSTFTQHTKTLKEKSRPDPQRFPVPPDKRSWLVEWPQYQPIYFVDPHVLKQFSQKGESGWADPENISQLQRELRSFSGTVNFDSAGRPLNPDGRIGLQGRGQLGKWGANFAADPIVTRIERHSGLLQIILIERDDCGELALPGGMVDSGEAPVQTLARELFEETKAQLCFDNASIVYQGVVDDRRNTDNAWIETSAAHLHLADDVADQVELRAGDGTNSAAWYTLTPQLLEALYSSHAQLIRIALAQYLKEQSAKIGTALKSQLEELL